MHSQIQERGSVNNNPLNDSIESDIPRGNARTVKKTKKKKVVVTGDLLLKGMNEKVLSRNHEVNVKNLLGGTSGKI